MGRHASKGGCAVGRSGHLNGWVTGCPTARHARSRSIVALTSVDESVPLARPALLNKPPRGVTRVYRAAGGHSTAARGGRALRTGWPPPAMADMPDLSHLTVEERAIIEGVMMRQRQEEQHEHEIMRCALCSTPHTACPSPRPAIIRIAIYIFTIYLLVQFCCKNYFLSCYLSNTYLPIKNIKLTFRLFFNMQVGIVSITQELLDKVVKYCVASL